MSHDHEPCPDCACGQCPVCLELVEPPVCAECGDDLAVEGYGLCLECLEKDLPGL